MGELIVVHEGYASNDQELLTVAFGLCRTYLARLVYLDGTTTDSRRARMTPTSHIEVDE